uniref:Uncharacterized protein n=1 Tax=Manihot esculenta TaxID=3983 RepID=A0A2C9U022_MANES
MLRKRAVVNIKDPMQQFCCTKNVLAFYVELPNY